MNSDSRFLGKSSRIAEAAVEKLKTKIIGILEKLIFFRRPVRRSIAFFSDVIFCFVASLFSYALRVGEWPAQPGPIVAMGLIALLFWIPLAWQFQVYRNLVRYSGGRSMAGLFYACAGLTVPLVIIFAFVQIPGVPRTMAVLQPIIFFLLLLFSRLGMRYVVFELVSQANVHLSQRRRLAIYGAGGAGQQLASSLRHEPHLRLVGFVDDDERLDGQRVDGLPVWHSAKLGRVIEDQEIDEVLLAIPSASRARRREIVTALQGRNIRVRMLPGIGQIIEGHVSTSDLRDVQVEDLLGRDPVAPDDQLMHRSIANKTVLVTGAGGSIGSELCRQILRAGAKRLILVERSEFSLYAIDAELRDLARSEGIAVDIVAELADMSDRDAVVRTFDRYRPESIYHAAAYKHVPLVESNPIAGLRNNIFCTLYCALAAEAAGVERFILVSTDKAVRPTNIMGASKRICELILQARAAEQERSLFAMVRFGNVLGSSGSVVPLFKKQIAAGGPVTVTHREVTRYFMTIPEASQLVIQAGSMACGGEVFVLDMGQPVQITDLAETMIRLTGLTVRDDANPHGDIEVVEVGLRPGEKLYEELLVGDDPAPTAHARIMQARDALKPWPELSALLERLDMMLSKGDAAAAIAIVRELVPEYRASASPNSTG